MAKKVLKTEKVKLPFQIEMDAAADVAEQELREFFLELEDDAGLLTFFAWYKKHYATAGHKRLGRILKTMAKGVEKMVPAAAARGKVASQKKVVKKPELPRWAGRKSDGSLEVKNPPKLFGEKKVVKKKVAKKVVKKAKKIAKK